VIGSSHSGGTLRVKELLTRNGHPFHDVDLDRDRDAQELLDRFHVDVADVPVVICRGATVMRNPTNAQIADCLGLNEGIDAVSPRSRASALCAQPTGCEQGGIARVRRERELLGVDREPAPVQFRAVQFRTASSAPDRDARPHCGPASLTGSQASSLGPS
jgi:hypothetical protein